MTTTFEVAGNHAPTELTTALTPAPASTPTALHPIDDARLTPAYLQQITTAQAQGDQKSYSSTVATAIVQGDAVSLADYIDFGASAMCTPQNAPGSCVAIVAMHAAGQVPAHRPVPQGWSTPAPGTITFWGATLTDAVDRAGADTLLALGQAGYGLYWTPLSFRRTDGNPLRAQALWANGVKVDDTGRTANNSVAARTLHIDVDAKDNIPLLAHLWNAVGFAETHGTDLVLDETGKFLNLTVPQRRDAARALGIAVQQFARAAALPTPSAIVASGSGSVQVLWHLDSDIAIEQWHHTGMRLAVLASQGIDLQAAVAAGTLDAGTAEALDVGTGKLVLNCDRNTYKPSQVLRLPGSLWTKQPGMVSAVELLGPDDGLAPAQTTAALSQFTSALQGINSEDLIAIANKGKTSASNKQAQAQNLFAGVDLSGAQDPTLKGEGAAYTGPRASWSRLRDASARGDGCKVIQWALRNQADVKYGLWTGILSTAKFTDDEDQAIVDTCSQHPDYDLHTCKAKAASFDGPRTCAVLEYDAKDSGCTGGCTGCPKQGTDKSPLGFGFVTAAETRATATEELFARAAAPAPAPAAPHTPTGGEDGVVVVADATAQGQGPAKAQSSLTALGERLPLHIPAPDPALAAKRIEGRPLTQHIVALQSIIIPEMMRVAGGACHSPEEAKKFAIDIGFDTEMAAAFMDTTVHVSDTSKGKDGSMWKTIDASGVVSGVQSMEVSFAIRTGKSKFYDDQKLRVWMRVNMERRRQAAQREVDAAANKLQAALASGADLTEYEAHLTAVKEEMTVVETSIKEAKKDLEKKVPNLMKAFMDALAQHRHITSYTLDVDMFNSVNHMYIPVVPQAMHGDEGQFAKPHDGTTGTMGIAYGVHKPFLPREMQKLKSRGVTIDPAMVQRVFDDYKQHAGWIEDFLDMITAARFSTTRKHAYAWLHAQSNFGKGTLLFGVLGDDGLGLVVKAPSMKWVNDINSNANVGTRPEDFEGKWIIVFDEVHTTGFEHGVKNLDESFPMTTKYGFTQTIHAYTKVCVSAKDVPSLVQAGLHDEEIRSRFIKLAGKGKWADRPGALGIDPNSYLMHLRLAVAQFIDQRVEYYRALGMVVAQRTAKADLETINLKHNIATVLTAEGERPPEDAALSTDAEEMAHDFAQWVVAGKRPLAPLHADVRSKMDLYVMKLSRPAADIEGSRAGDYYLDERHAQDLYQVFIKTLGHTSIVINRDMWSEVQTALRRAGKTTRDRGSKMAGGERRQKLLRLLGYNEADEASGML